MTVRLRLSPEMTADERRTLFEWDENVFGTTDKLYSWRPKDRHLYVEEGEQVVCHVGLLEEVVNAGGERVKVCGVGGVVTVPEAQGRGHARLAMRRAAEIMRGETDAEFGMLYCLDRLVPFYASLGWQLIEEGNVFGQPGGPALSPFNVMVLPLRGGEWPAGRVVVEGLPW